jgi:PIN domain nuclease of toxin-antitoxin system
LRLLLDTHIWLWTLSDPRRLGRRVLQQLKDEANELWLSPISTYEALTLHYKGRFEIDGNLTEWLARATAGTREAPLTHEIALLARQLSLHQDPADRILAATTEVLDLTLVTADERLLGLGTIRTLGNRYSYSNGS